MSIMVQFTACNDAELAKKITNFLRRSLGREPISLEEPEQLNLPGMEPEPEKYSTTPEMNETLPLENLKSTRKPRGPNKKKNTTSPPQEAAPVVEDDGDLASEPTIKVTTREDALQALQKVNSEKGLPTARVVLAKFGCQRISEVKEEQYSDFVAACLEVLKV